MNREIKAMTGVEGAKMYELILRLELLKSTGIEITDDLEKEMKNKINLMDWKDGVYEISSNTGMIYKGKYE